MKLSLILVDEHPSDGQSRSRRIWEVDPTVLSLVTGVLLRREDVESILRDVGVDWTGAREDALRVRLLIGCTRQCVLAEQVERALEDLTQEFRGAVKSCPMIQLAEQWSRTSERMTGEQIAALLWRLGTDPRPHLEGLSSRVRGELCVRAMRLVREKRSASIAGAADETADTFAPRLDGSTRSTRVETARAPVV
jgi:hypothetical protein